MAARNDTVPPMQKPIMPVLPAGLRSSAAAATSRSMASQSILVEIGSRLGDLVGRIAGLETARAHAVEQSRRHRRIAFRRQPVADIADMIVDPENFLHHDHAALAGPLRVGAIGAELMFVGGGQREMLAQVFLLVFFRISVAGILEVPKAKAMNHHEV